MLQEIIVYIILSLSFGYTFYNMLGFFNLFKGKNKSSACGSCASGSCGTCSLKTYQHLPESVQSIKIDSKNIKPMI